MRREIVYCHLIKTFTISPKVTGTTQPDTRCASSRFNYGIINSIRFHSIKDCTATNVDDGASTAILEGLRLLLTVEKTVVVVAVHCVD